MPPLPPPPGMGALMRDQQGEWLDKMSERAVEKGRLSPQAAAYFKSSLNMMPEFREIVDVAKDKIGDQDPEKFTAYQQRMVSQAVSVKASEVASKSINKVLKEQSDMSAMDEGEPTGENYWLESPMGLASTEVPPDVKDDILASMQKDRAKDSPAFGIDDPNVGSQKAADMVLEGKQLEQALHGSGPKRTMVQPPDAAPATTYVTPN